MLTKKNKRMVRKMKKYIKTFPLTEKEIDQMIEDITGMAEEAQERNENFETVLGKSVHEFCDDLIYSVGGIFVFWLENVYTHYGCLQLQ